MSRKCTFKVKSIPYIACKVNNLPGENLIMYYNNCPPLKVFMAVIVKLLFRNPNVTGSNLGVATFFLYFIYKSYLNFINYTTHNKT